MSVSRIRLPSWHHSAYEPDEGSDIFVMAFEYLVLAPLFWFVLPLIRAIVLLPIALVRLLFSSSRWIEAVCRDDTGTVPVTPGKQNDSPPERGFAPREAHRQETVDGASAEPAPSTFRTKPPR